MLALYYDGEPELREDYPAPKPGRGEVLVRVHKAGICATDLEVARGYMQFRGVMGHEFVGTVVGGSRAWRGRRVVAEINCVCGRCDLCRSGLSNHCRNRTVLGISGHDGCFAELLALPARNLHEVPAALADEQAVFTEPLAAAMQVARQVKLTRTNEVVVLGDGRLAQLIVRVLKGRVRRTVMVGRHPAKLEAAEKQGVQAVSAEQFVPRADVGLVVDATGSPSGFELAMRTVRPRGTIVLKSTFAAESGMNLAPLVVNEVAVIGSRCGPFPDALRALAEGEVDVSALISAEFALDRGLEALRAAAGPKHLKVLLDAGR